MAESPLTFSQLLNREEEKKKKKVPTDRRCTRGSFAPSIKAWLLRNVPKVIWFVYRFSSERNFTCRSVKCLAVQFLSFSGYNNSVVVFFNCQTPTPNLPFFTVVQLFFPLVLMCELTFLFSLGKKSETRQTASILKQDPNA